MTLILMDIFEEDDEEKAVKDLHNLYLSGASTTKLAKALGTTDVTIRKYFKKYNLKIKEQGGHYTGKHILITEEEYKTLSTKELMKKYNCSQFTLYNLTKNFESKCGREKRYFKVKTTPRKNRLAPLKGT
jgi:transposase